MMDVITEWIIQYLYSEKKWTQLKALLLEEIDINRFNSEVKLQVCLASTVIMMQASNVSMSQYESAIECLEICNGILPCRDMQLVTFKLKAILCIGRLHAGSLDSQYVKSLFPPELFVTGDYVSRKERQFCKLMFYFLLHKNSRKKFLAKEACWHFGEKNLEEVKIMVMTQIDAFSVQFFPSVSPLQELMKNKLESKFWQDLSHLNDPLVLGFIFELLDLRVKSADVPQYLLGLHAFLSCDSSNQMKAFCDNLSLSIKSSSESSAEVINSTPESSPKLHKSSLSSVKKQSLVLVETESPVVLVEPEAPVVLVEPEAPVVLVETEAPVVLVENEAESLVEYHHSQGETEIHDLEISSSQSTDLKVVPVASAQFLDISALGMSLVGLSRKPLRHHEDPSKEGESVELYETCPMPSL